MGVEYDGSRFHGWQLQHEEPTVQLAVERALSLVANHPVRVMCAGRTDARVHAAGQVIHFDTTAIRPLHGWVLGTNTNLGQGVSALWVRQVPGNFNARFSATGRHYRYQILNRWTRPALGRAHLSWYHKPLDVERMRAGVPPLIGEHDFSSFRAAACQAKHGIRRMHSIEIQRQGDRVILDVHANAFLHHMVRNLAGTLMAVGCGEREPGWVSEVLAARDRRVSGNTAPAEGLCLMAVDYDPQWGLPVGTGAAFPREQ